MNFLLRLFFGTIIIAVLTALFIYMGLQDGHCCISGYRYPIARRLELHRRFFYYPHNFTVDSQLIIVSGAALKIISAMGTSSNASIFGGMSSPSVSSS